MPSKLLDLRFLLVVCVFYFVRELWQIGTLFQAGIDGYLFKNGNPVGEDFLNLWATARLVLEGRTDIIYKSTDFLNYEIGLVGQEISFHVWVYPIHSLLVVWPFGLMSYYVALVAWSALGLLALVIGARAIGLRPLETAIVLFSPATISCLYCGQTGNLATGLLLIALSNWPRMPRVLAAVALTIKPQMGFLLPVVWFKEKRWFEIIWTSALTISVVGFSVIWFGVDVLRDYLFDTMVILAEFEKHGTGVFMRLIPSVFMSLRILGVEGGLALTIHMIFAVPALIFIVVKLLRTEDRMRRIGIALAGTAFVTPYLHNYDFNILVVSALLLFRRRFEVKEKPDVVLAIVALTMILPVLLAVLYATKLPVAPLLILALLVLS